MKRTPMATPTSLALTVALVAPIAACSTNAPPTEPPAHTEPAPTSPSPPTPTPSDPAPLVQADSFVAISNSSRIHVAPDPDAAWISTSTAGDTENPNEVHAYTIARVLSRRGRFVQVTLLDEDYGRHCVSPNVLSGVTGFVDVDRLMLVTTQPVTLEEQWRSPWTLPPGIPVLRGAASDVLYTEKHRVELEERLEHVGMGYLPSEEPTCVDPMMVQNRLAVDEDLPEGPFAGVKVLEPTWSAGTGRTGFGWPRAHVFTRGGESLGSMHIERLKHTHGEAHPTEPGRRCFPIVDVRPNLGGADICAVAKELTADLSVLPEPRIEIVALEFEGDVDESILRKELNAAKRHLRSCYGRQYLHDALGRGEVTVEMKFDYTGPIVSLEGAATAKNPTMQACIARQVIHFAVWKAHPTRFRVVYSYAPANP